MKIKHLFKGHRPTIIHVVKSTLLIAAATTIVFGISAGSFAINYVRLYDINNRIQSAKIANYYSQNIKSEWNLNDGLVQTYQDSTGKSNNYKSKSPNQQIITRQQWEDLHGKGTLMPTDPITIGGISVNPKNMKLDSKEKIKDNDVLKVRYKYASMILDGSAHSALDHSFNQSLYSGIANFIYNELDTKIVGEDQAQIYRPGQDTNSYFQDIYREASRNSRVVCLAGYNHVSPLSTLANQDLDSNNNPTSLVKYDHDCTKTGFVLIDGDIPNNQNVASVLFRSDQPAFLTGLATCTYFYNNLDVYHANGQPLSVAIYGGTAIPTVTIYMGGYQRGIEFFNRFILKDKILDNDFKKWLKQLKKFSKDSFIWMLINNSVNKKIRDLKEKKGQLLTNDDEINELINEMGQSLSEDEINELINDLYDEFSIKIISLGATPTHFSGSFVAGDAIGITKQYLNRGASAIICVAGPQSLDTAQEIKNRGSKCIVIGVDSAMETSDYQRSFNNYGYEDKTIDGDGNKSAQKNNIIKFSAVKDMTTICEKFIRLNTGKDDNQGNLEPLNWDVSCEPYQIDDDLDSGEYKSENILKLSLEDIDNIGKKISDVKNAKDIIKCIDMHEFTNNEAIENLNTKIPENIFANWNHNGEGWIKFNNKISDYVKKDFIENILIQKAKLSNQWFKSCPDPNKSICNIGYKTCGNIQNGLISISFDGWYFLAKALLETNDIWIKPNNSTKAENEKVSFKEAWKITADDYLKTHPNLPSKLHDIDELLTFNRQKEITSEESQSNGSTKTIKVLYNDIMYILGQLFSSFAIDFSNAKEMSIDFDGDNNPIQPVDENIEMTILTWLTKNMYFCC